MRKKISKRKREEGSVGKEAVASARRELNNDVKQTIYFIYDDKCAVCGYTNNKDNNIIHSKKSKNRLTGNGNAIHHIWPVHLGGQSYLSNLILLCPTHHKEAHDGLFKCEDYNIKGLDIVYKLCRTPEDREKINNFLNAHLSADWYISSISWGRAHEIEHLISNDFILSEVIWSSDNESTISDSYYYPEILLHSKHNRKRIIERISR